MIKRIAKNETTANEVNKISFHDWTKILKTRTIAIVGNIGSGKTCLALALLSRETQRPVYIYRYPKPDLLRQMGSNIRIMYSIEDLATTHNSVVYIDEIQLHIPTYDKKTNDALRRVLSLMRQRNNTIVIGTSDTRFVTRGLESYIETWMIKDIDIDLVKQGSKIKKIMNRYSLVLPSELKLNVNEFILDIREMPEISGRHTFSPPAFWNESLSTPYNNQTAKESAKKQVIEVVKNEE